MDVQHVQVVAGFISSCIFICSNLPMLYKALITKDLRSYSLAHIGLANVGNLLHWVYVAGLPVGPIWWLHGFNTAVAMLMLGFYVRYEMQGTGLGKRPFLSILPKLNKI
jgi:hypothetical protein